VYGGGGHTEQCSHEQRAELFMLKKQQEKARLFLSLLSVSKSQGNPIQIVTQANLLTSFPTWIVHR